MIGDGGLEVTFSDVALDVPVVDSAQISFLEMPLGNALRTLFLNNKFNFRLA